MYFSIHIFFNLTFFLVLTYSDPVFKAHWYILHILVIMSRGIKVKHVCTEVFIDRRAIDSKKDIL